MLGARQCLRIAIQIAHSDLRLFSMAVCRGFEGDLECLERMAFAVSDELLGTFVPIAVYWLYSGLYIVLDAMGMDDYRLHPKGEEATKNVVSKWTVVKGVLVQQSFQIAVSLLLFTVTIPLLTFVLALLLVLVIGKENSVWGWI